MKDDCAVLSFLWFDSDVERESICAQKTFHFRADDGIVAAKLKRRVCSGGRVPSCHQHRSIFQFGDVGRSAVSRGVVRDSVESKMSDRKRQFHRSTLEPQFILPGCALGDFGQLSFCEFNFRFQRGVFLFLFCAPQHLSGSRCGTSEVRIQSGLVDAVEEGKQ